MPAKPLWPGAVLFGCSLTFGQNAGSLPVASSHLFFAASSVRVKWLSGLDEFHTISSSAAIETALAFSRW